MRDDGDLTVFVQLLSRVVLERRWILHSWVLMTNHLHLVVETPVPNLSARMRGTSRQGRLAFQRCAPTRRPHEGVGGCGRAFKLGAFGRVVVRGRELVR